MKAKEKEQNVLLTENIPIQEYRQVVIKLSEQDALLEEVLTAESIGLLSTRRCSNCHIHIVKNGGCSHMYFSRCHHRFIWGQTEKHRVKASDSLLKTIDQASIELESVKEELYKVTNIGLLIT